MELSNIAKALSDKTRYNLIRLLLQHNYCVGALSKRLNISESAVSQHLKILREAEIVRGEKRGYYTHYFINRDLLRQAAYEIIQLAELESVNSCSKKNSDYYKCCKEEMNHNNNIVDLVDKEENNE